MAETGVASPMQAVESAGRHKQSMEFQQKKTTPNHTLFGTNLDHTNRDSLKDIKGRYISEGYIKPVSERFPLPPHLKDRIPGQDKLESARHTFLQQKGLFGEADKHLKMKQEQALTFSDVRHDIGLENLKAARTVNSTADKIKNVEEDKPRLRTLRNNLFEDTVAINNLNTQLPVKETKSAYIKNRENGWRRYQPIAYDVKQQSVCFVELPANIRHKFGSRNCDALLCNKDLVAMSIDKQKSVFRHRKLSKINDAAGFQVNLDGDYENLGQKLRYDIFPGLTIDHTISQAHTDFSNQIHLRRVKNPVTFHHKRDDLITWSEQNILRERMKKAWDERFPLDGKQQ